MITIHSRNDRPIRALSIINQVEHGKPHTFVCYSDGDAPKWWTPFLKSGYKHCFLVHWDGELWLRIEKHYGCMTVSPILWIDRLFVGTFNLEPYFEKLGFIVQVVDLGDRKPDKLRVKPLFAPNTCVESVKDFLGISAYFVNTPYQLFKYLEGRKHGK